MPLLDVLRFSVDGLVLGGDRTFDRLVPILFFAELDVALLPEKGLEVVAGDDLLLLVLGRIGVAGRWVWV